MIQSARRYTERGKTIADEVLDGIVYHSHRFEMVGGSLEKGDYY